jgi:hypothetical protein
LPGGPTRRSRWRKRSANLRWGRSSRKEQARGTVESERGDWGFQRAPKKLLVALGSGADSIDEQVSPGHGGGGGSLRRDAEAGGCIVRGRAQPELRARLVGLALWGLMDSEIGIYWGGFAQQIQEGLQSGAVGV